MMGFPINYTNQCSPKSQRKVSSHLDDRHSLIGNSWSVAVVVAWFLSQLFGRLGFCPTYTPQELVELLCPGQQALLQARLWRLPLRPQRGRGDVSPETLVYKLSNLISIKGEDILLSAPTSQLTKFQRLRGSIPSRLWRWKVVAGWQWRKNAEHINQLELRAILTTWKWRIEKRQQTNTRFIHMTDSLVCLHILSRGRSSPRRLRSVMARINALLLASSCQALWGYVHTDSNPADKPSRWGRRVRTKFRNA